MEFPRHLHKPDGLYVRVIDAEQYDAAKANGWADLPEHHVEKPVEVRFEQAINGAVIDFDATAPPTDDAPVKRGRKPKAH